LLPTVQGITDCIAYGLLLYFTVLRTFLKQQTKTSKLRCLGISLLLLYLMVVNVLHYTIEYKRYPIQQIISFLIIILFIRSLRESWKRIF
jgi:hypothetical protein